MSAPPPSLRAELIEQTRSLPSPTRKQERGRARWAVVAGACLVLAASLRHGVPQPSASRPLAYIAIGASVALATALFVSWWLFAPTRSALGRCVSCARALVWLAPLSLCAGVAAAGSIPRAVASETPHPPFTGLPFSAHLACLCVFAALGALLLGLAFGWLKRFDPVAPRATGALVGACVGAWTSLAMLLECPSSDTAHGIFTHVAPGIAFALFGGFLGARRFAPRLRGLHTKNPS